MSNQMHKHTFSCFKYCRPCGSPLICRHDFPYIEDDITNSNEPVIRADYDKKKRRRITVLPPRNNGWLNATFFSPFLTLAHAGNHDVQYISNAVGAAEYTASYISKTDTADFNLVCNLIYKTLNREWCSNSDLHRLKCVGNAILDSTPIGSVECMYSLLGLQFVKKSRNIENVNALDRSKMSKALELDNERLERMDVDDEPVKKGINSHFGKRDAYEMLSKYMWTNFNQCHITFYAMLANFTISNKSKKQLLEPSCLITLDDSGTVIDDGNINKFSIGDIVYTRRIKNAVLNLCPYIPTDLMDETSCYAILLLHVPWPLEGEEYIRGDFSDSAVKQLQSILSKEADSPGLVLPKYVNPLLQRTQNSQSLFENNTHNDRHDNDNDLDNNVDDDDESVIIQDHDIVLTMNFDELYEKPVSANEVLIFNEIFSLRHVPLSKTYRL